MISNSVYIGVVLTIGSYLTGISLKKHIKSTFFNPLLFAIILCSLILIITNISYEAYYSSAKYVSYLLTPSTVCLAIPLYRQLNLLKRNWQAVLAGIISGTVASLSSIFLLSKMFLLSHEQYVTLLPKSVTTAIGVGIVEQLGGFSSITVAVIVLTGIAGAILAQPICKLFKITEPIAKGVAIGTSSHALGTTKAVEMGEIEGAMSSLSIAVAGIVTVLLAPIFANFI